MGDCLGSIGGFARSKGCILCNGEDRMEMVVGWMLVSLVAPFVLFIAR